MWKTIITGAFDQTCSTTAKCCAAFARYSFSFNRFLFKNNLFLHLDLLKKTENDNPDYNFITKAIEQIKFALEYVILRNKAILQLLIFYFVNSKINEDKRKTECQLAMFEIIHGIDDCPPTLLSAQRKFIAKIDVKLLTKNEDEEIIAHKHTDFTIFLFTDLLEVLFIMTFYSN